MHSSKSAASEAVIRERRHVYEDIERAGRQAGSAHSSSAGCIYKATARKRHHKDSHSVPQGRRCVSRHGQKTTRPHEKQEGAIGGGTGGIRISLQRVRELLQGFGTPPLIAFFIAESVPALSTARARAPLLHLSAGARREGRPGRSRGRPACRARYRLRR